MTTDHKPWRNAAGNNDRAWQNSDAWKVNHDSNAVRATIDGCIATNEKANALGLPEYHPQPVQAS
ncbi:MAG: hypothetical protein ACPHJ3_12985 [Rubripirellula sp.]